MQYKPNCVELVKVIVAFTYLIIIKKVNESLSKNNDVVIMKQDRGSGVVIINKPKYHEKCLELLNTDQCTKLNHDPTKKIEAKIQRVLRKIKTNLTSQEYSRLWPTGS